MGNYQNVGFEGPAGLGLHWYQTCFASLGFLGWGTECFVGGVGGADLKPNTIYVQFHRQELRSVTIS